ncbi:MAG: hypothetical protein C5S48_02020 [Candidatus Methanogaster sp.]|nr:MAG: hypothetical protein C5S48_02020 [ANME-2 cluster archaeon]
MTRLLLVAAAALVAVLVAEVAALRLGMLRYPVGRHGSRSGVWVCGGRRSLDRGVAESGVIAADAV